MVYMLKIKLFIKKHFLNSKNKWIALFTRKLIDCVYRSKLYEIIKYKPHMSDKKYIEWLYKKRFDKQLMINAPCNFNEKNNWRKLYDRKDEYTLMVDKYRMKDIVDKKVFLALEVKVEKDWRKKDKFLKNFGYTSEE